MRSVRYIIFFLLMMFLVGMIASCSRQEQANLTEPKEVIAFFCGCGGCAQAVETLGADLVSNAKIYYAGSDGDAQEFQITHHLKRKVEADLNRSIASSYGVTTCPTFVLSDGSNYRVLGNGLSLTDEDFVSVRKVLSRKFAFKDKTL
ncbi:MAG TPA: hypothetical protein VNK96_01965 [Fimbriimonadales bacterium]|nr:hypothetical protein [Fimbriimonadales bacterium]